MMMHYIPKIYICLSFVDLTFIDISSEDTHTALPVEYDIIRKNLADVCCTDMSLIQSVGHVVTVASQWLLIQT